MRELRVVKEGNVKPFIAENVVDVSSSNVTMEQLDTKMKQAELQNEQADTKLKEAGAMLKQVQAKMEPMKVIK